MAVSTGMLALVVILLLAMASSGDTARAPFAPRMTETAPRELRNSQDDPRVVYLMENLWPCAAYVVKGSRLAAPERECCVGLAAVASEHPHSFCALMDAVDGGAYGIDIDQGRASKLQGSCKVEIPPLRSMCADAAATSPAPGPGTPVPYDQNHLSRVKCSGIDPGLGSPTLALLSGLVFATAAFF